MKEGQGCFARAQARDENWKVTQFDLQINFY
jgi:hypothetical protein